MRSSRWRQIGVAGLVVSLISTILFGVASVTLAVILSLQTVGPFEHVPLSLSAWFLLITAGFVVVAAATLCLLVGLIVSTIKSIEPASDTYALLARLERANDVVASVRPTRFIEEWLSPHERTERRRKTLRERYVSGNISKQELERQLERLYRDVDDSVSEHADATTQSGSVTMERDVDQTYGSE